MMNIRKSLLLLFVLAFISQAVGQGKPGTEVIETAVAKLQQKVLLTDQQASDVKTMITRNTDNIKNEKGLNDLKAKLEAMLNARQKAKYSIIKDDWWSNLSRDLNQQ